MILKLKISHCEEQGVPDTSENFYSYSIRFSDDSHILSGVAKSINEIPAKVAKDIMQAWAIGSYYAEFLMSLA